MSDPIQLLALDLSSSTGWCHINQTDPITVYTSSRWKLDSSTQITRIMDLDGRLQVCHKKYPFDTIVFERVDFSRFVMAHASYNQLLATVYHFASRYELPLYGVPVKVLKKVSTGNGNAKKEQMIAEANKLWPDMEYTLKNNDEVDARLLAKYTFDQLSDPITKLIFKDKYDIRKIKEKNK